MNTLLRLWRRLFRRHEPKQQHTPSWSGILTAYLASDESFRRRRRAYSAAVLSEGGPDYDISQADTLILPSAIPEEDEWFYRSTTTRVPAISGPIMMPRLRLPATPPSLLRIPQAKEPAPWFCPTPEEQAILHGVDRYATRPIPRVTRLLPKQ
jgi:hypothetical protein